MPESPLILYSILTLQKVPISMLLMSICAETASHSRECAPEFPSWRQSFVLLNADARSKDHFPYHHWRYHDSNGGTEILFHLSAADCTLCAVWNIQPFCFITAAHCFRSAPSSSGIPCLLPYRNCICISGVQSFCRNQWCFSVTPNAPCASLRQWTGHFPLFPLDSRILSESVFAAGSKLIADQPFTISASLQSGNAAWLI